MVFYKNKEGMTTYHADIVSVEQNLLELGVAAGVITKFFAGVSIKKGRGLC